MPLKIFSSLVVALMLSACRVVVTVPEGGEVVSTDGEYRCFEGAPCSVDASTPDVAHTFVANADPDWQFVAWRKANGYLCGGEDGSCTVDTTGAADDPDMEALIASDITVNLSPIFVPDPILPNTHDFNFTEKVVASTAGDQLSHNLDPEDPTNVATASCTPETLDEVRNFTETWTLDPANAVFRIDGEVAGDFYFSPDGIHTFTARVKEREYICGPDADPDYCANGGDTNHGIVEFQDTIFKLSGTYDPSGSGATIDGTIEGRRVLEWNLTSKKSTCTFKIDFTGTADSGEENF